MANINGTEVIMVPPDGYMVNLKNPPQIGKTEMFIVVIAESILAFAFLCQRLYTQTFLKGKPQIEDATLLFSWVTSMATQAMLLQLYVVKAVGVHAYEMPLERYQYFSRVIFAAPLVYTFTVASAKATLCLFYRRLSPFKTYRIFVWVTMFFCVGSSMAIFLSLVFACRPIPANWDPILAKTAQCVDIPAIYVATAGIGVFTDAILLALPIPVVIGLNMPTRQKVYVILLFVMGSITLVTSIIRLVILLPSLSNPDQTYALTQGTLWICIEANLLIMCCCLSTLKRFFRHVAPAVIGEKTSVAKSFKQQDFELRTIGSIPMNKHKPRGPIDETYTEEGKGPAGCEQQQVEGYDSEGSENFLVGPMETTEFGVMS